MEFAAAFLLVLFGAVLIIATWYLSTSIENAFRNLPPFLPSTNGVVEKLPSILKLTKDSVFYDIGSGNGKVIFAMARVYPESCCIGIERGSFQYFLGRTRSYFYPQSNVTLIRDDFFNAHVKNATHLYLYLLPHTVQTLFPKLESELKPGSIVVSCDFPYKKREADKIIEISGTNAHTLYVYHL